MNNQKIPVIGLVVCTLYTTLSLFAGLIHPKYMTFCLPFINHCMSLSVSLPLCPIHYFLCDIGMELYGQQFTKLLMITSAVTCCLMAPILEWMIYVDSAHWSSISSTTFHAVFRWYKRGLAAAAIATVASQVAYLVVSMFTRKIGIKKSWIRTSSSNVASQITYSACMITMLGILQILPLSELIRITGNDIVVKLSLLGLETAIIGICIKYFRRKDQEWQISVFK